MRPVQSLPPDYFERMFAAENDPWSFETSDYEKAKYDVTIVALDGRNYEAGFEIGCANGVLTKRLARQCASLLAIDVSASALSRAKARCADVAGVTFAEMTFPSQQPTGVFDLIVMSELAYYCSEIDLERASDYVRSHLQPSGDLLLVHWTGTTDYPQSGDGAVALMRKNLQMFDVVRADRHDEYRLDLWRKP